VIGVRIGAVAGAKASLAAGVGTDEIAAAISMSSVTRDATSSIYCPANAMEWMVALSTAGISSGNPTNCYPLSSFAVASGNLTDTIGTDTLTVNSTPTFQQAVSGWTALGITYAISTAQRHTNSTTSPNAGSTSLMMLLYALPPAADPGLVRGICQVGTTVELRCNSAAPARMTVVNGATTAGTGTFTGTTVRPLVLRYNRTATTVTGFNDVEKITGTYAAASGPMVSVGSQGTTEMGFTGLYCAVFSGVAAEMSDAQVKLLLQTLGWTILWT
jgi:hypothetical protein